jgi:hypothetical protein
MTVAEIIAEVRFALDDPEQTVPSDSLWSDDEIISALNWAERDLCRLRMIVDSTSAVTTFPVAAVATVYPRTYPISALIRDIERLKYSGVSTCLTQMTREELDVHDPGWEDMEGIPSAFIVDRGFITFSRWPTADATVTMTVVRKPLAPMSLGGSPEVVGVDEELMHGALSRLYLKPDTETFDKTAAARWKSLFMEDMSALQRESAALSPQVYATRPERF